MVSRIKNMSNFERGEFYLRKLRFTNSEIAKAIKANLDSTKYESYGIDWHYDNVLRFRCLDKFLYEDWLPVFLLTKNNDLFKILLNSFKILNINCPIKYEWFDEIMKIYIQDIDYRLYYRTIKEEEYNLLSNMSIKEFLAHIFF